jgi:putative oxidoreductase
MTAIPTPSRTNIDRALLLLRLILGIVFIVHGSQKLFTIGISGMVAGFTKSGIPLPAVTAPLVTFVEFGGSIALILGVATRLAALLLTCDMLGAIAFVHAKNGFMLPTGYEFALTLACIAFALVLAGPGAYSIEEIWQRRAS